MANIGLFTGNFDPINEGQILFAQTVLDQFYLEKILFVPKFSFSKTKPLASLPDRQQMITIATEQFEGLELISKKYDSENTLDSLVDKFAEDNTAILMGADRFEDLLADKSESANRLKTEFSYVVALMSEDDGEVVMPWAVKEKIDVEFLPSPLSSVSSIGIRRSLMDGEPAKGLNDDVGEFITSNRLYTE